MPSKEKNLWTKTNGRKRVYCEWAWFEVGDNLCFFTFSFPNWESREFFFISLHKSSIKIASRCAICDKKIRNSPRGLESQNKMFTFNRNSNKFAFFCGRVRKVNMLNEQLSDDAKRKKAEELGRKFLVAGDHLRPKNTFMASKFFFLSIKSWKKEKFSASRDELIIFDPCFCDFGNVFYCIWLGRVHWYHFMNLLFIRKLFNMFKHQTKSWVVHKKLEMENSYFFNGATWSKKTASAWWR